MTCDEFKLAIHHLFKRHVAEAERPALEASAAAHRAACTDCEDFMQLVERLSCRELIEFLNDYLDDVLPTARRAVFEEHLQICPDCKNYLDAYRKTMEMSVASMMKQGDHLDAPPEELVRAILKARGN